ncbi:hypothetical protein CLV28_2226 [Sediminihabitans luteus]|uniref:Uncharacterized protein n=1 Tax=Sediminihabitans luteus TaxID=1138585 RepID=A0A2M9CEN4_9CELL|nr:hypothetical protein [Sediminihabitans luteus]PJJ70391.1 hypothetical protein CLV28_2226 [Sediminihabitans luteus]GII97863.1 hypothetical protein Slu03_02410 [Sediminihabitans luteus]
MAPRGQRAAVLAVVVVAVALPLLTLWGAALDARGEVMLAGAAMPFVGTFHLDAGPWTGVAALVAAAVVAWGPRAATTWRWRPLLLAAWAATLAWTVALAATAGWSTLTAPLLHEQDYLAAVPDVAADPAGFVATLQDDPVAYPVHVRGHPPAFTLLLAGLDRLGLGGAGWAAALVILAGTSAVVAVAITLRALGAERTARLALPAVVLAPSALWVATSADAFYAGALAWGVALLAMASRLGPDGRTRGRWALAVAAGVVLGAAPFLSWGLAHMALVVLAVPIVTRRWAPTVVAGAVVLASVVAWGIGGYWIWDGLAATHEAFTRGIADARPYLYFVVADAALLAVLIGPAGVGGLTRWRELDRGTRWLAGLALATAAAGALGGFEKGEVERIWLPVACWVVPAAAALATRPVTGRAGRSGTTVADDVPAGFAPTDDLPRPGWAGTLRWWLVAQALAALAIETFVRTAW